jgi:hypothetical protein
MFNVWGATTQRITIQKDLIILQSDGKTAIYHKVDRFSWD